MRVKLTVPGTVSYTSAAMCPSGEPVFFFRRDLVSVETLKQRYHELIKIYHPDRHPMRTEWANRITQRINTA